MLKEMNGRSSLQNLEVEEKNQRLSKTKKKKELRLEENKGTIAADNKQTN